MIEQLKLQLLTQASANDAGRFLIQFALVGDASAEGNLFLDTRGDAPAVGTSITDQPQTVMSLSAVDMNDMLGGRLDPVKAFMSGRMKIDGDMSIAMKLAALFKPAPAHAHAHALATLVEPAPPTQPMSASRHKPAASTSRQATAINAPMLTARHAAQKAGGSYRTCWPR